MVKKTQKITSVSTEKDNILLNSGEPPLHAKKIKKKDICDVCMHVLAFQQSANGEKACQSLNIIINICRKSEVLK